MCPADARLRLSKASASAVGGENDSIIAVYLTVAMQGARFAACESCK